MADDESCNAEPSDQTGEVIGLSSASDGVPVIDAVHLLGRSREARVLYGNLTYRLQLTASGKLILTK